MNDYPWIFVPQAVSGEQEEPSQVSVVGHVAGGSAEFRVGFDDFVHGLQEILLGGDFPACSDSEHSCLRADTADLSTWERGTGINNSPLTARDTANTELFQ